MIKDFSPEILERQLEYFFPYLSSMFTSSFIVSQKENRGLFTSVLKACSKRVEKKEWRYYGDRVTVVLSKFCIGGLRLKP